MIKIGKHWELTNDTHSWTLTQFGMKRVMIKGVPTGERKWGEINKTFHGNLSGILTHIVDQDAKQATSLEGLISSIRTSVDIIRDAICVDALKEVAEDAIDDVKVRIV